MSSAADIYSTLALEAVERCEVLAGYSEDPNVYTRTYLSAPMRGVHEEIGRWMREVGMEVRIDAIGNIVGRLPASVSDAPVLITGSHLDTVPNAGRYDGILGVIAGLSAARLLGERERSFHLDVIGFAEEEGVRYRTPYLGSRAVAGSFEKGWLALTDDNGVSLAEAIAAFGGDPDDVTRVLYDYSRVAGFFELHIEQGPVLESKGLAVGAVSGIAGQERTRAVFLGRAGHAGTTPMDLRNDAFCALAELALAVESIARETAGLFATVGFVEVKPGSGNVIPGRAAFSLDVRHGNQVELDLADERIKEKAREIASRRDLRFMIESEWSQAVQPCNDELTGRMVDSIADAGQQSFTLVSGAGHDAAVMARVTPTTMLFVRTPDGVSHNPAERVDAADVAVALRVLDRFLIATDAAVRAGEQ